MPDREKVIDGLIGAIGLIHGYIPKRIWSESYGEQACRDAILLLKEQEPMKPKVKHFEIHYASYDEYENRAYCPKCGIQFVQQVNYCPKCGQAVKWDD